MDSLAETEVASLGDFDEFGDEDEDDITASQKILEQTGINEALEDTVADVFAKGYLFRGHLVRPARVTVHKAD